LLWQYKCQFTRTVTPKTTTNPEEPHYHLPIGNAQPPTIPNSVHVPMLANDLSTIPEAQDNPSTASEGEIEGAPPENIEQTEGVPEGAPGEAEEAANENDGDDNAVWDDSACDETRGTQQLPTRRSRYERRLGRKPQRYINEYIATIVAYEVITEPMEGDS
jgi:hypothetical protein